MMITRHFHDIATCVNVQIAAIFGLFTEFGWGYDETYNFLQGIACIQVCISILRYFGYSKRFYKLVLTWVASVGRVICFVLTALPIFFGFALFGTLNFSQYADRFSSLSGTFMTLFSVMNGDELHETFMALDHTFPSPLISEIYLYTFITFFLTSVLNVFIFIIEDGYHASKRGRMCSIATTHGVETTQYDQVISDEELLAIIFDNIEVWKARSRTEFSEQPEDYDAEEQIFLNDDDAIPLTRLGKEKGRVSEEEDAASLLPQESPHSAALSPLMSRIRNLGERQRSASKSAVLRAIRDFSNSRRQVDAEDIHDLIERTSECLSHLQCLLSSLGDHPTTS